MNKASVSRKSPPLLMLNEDPQKAQEEGARISGAVSDMYSKIKSISWAYPGGKEYFQIKEVDVPECDVLSKEGNVVTTEMELLIETYSLRGPVLGLSFSEVYTYWMASAALGERIYINDLHHPFQISKKKMELPEIASATNTQTTCLKWSNMFPCVLASTSETGVTKIWDLRASKATITFTSQDDKTCSSDLEFSLNNPWYLAVSSASNETSAAVKIWDLRYSLSPCHKYGCGDSGVLSLSWNRSDQLLGSHKDGSFSCYDIYKDKILEEMNLKSLHCDLGMTWTHADDTVATFSSQNGVKLSEVGWLLND